MGLKILRAAWFTSVLALFGALLYAYAAWRREEVVIGVEAGKQTVIHRETLFYGLTVVFLLINVLVYVISTFYAKSEAFRAWFHGLIMTFNIFFIISVSIIALFNSGEYYDASRLPYFVYGGIILIAAWALAWPFYLIYQKIFFKRLV